MSDKMISLVSSDGETFPVEKNVITMSALVNNCLEDVSEEEQTVPLPEVNAQTLAKVIEYCRYHTQLKSAPQSEEDIEKWDQAFVQVEKATLFNIIKAANYLDIQPLLDLTCKTVADMIKGKSPEEIRQEFGIVNDFTPEEEEEVRRENAWCEER